MLAASASVISMVVLSFLIFSFSKPNLLLSGRPSLYLKDILFDFDFGNNESSIYSTSISVAEFEQIVPLKLPIPVIRIALT